MKKIKFNKSITVMLLIIILLLIVSISGCSSLKIGDYNINIEHVNSTDTINNTDIKKTTITPEERIKNNFISETYDEIYVNLLLFDKFSQTECITKLTQLQCNEERKNHTEWLRKNINNHYISLIGKIINVGRDSHTGLTVAYVKLIGYEDVPDSQHLITLHDISKDKLIKLNKNEIIDFTGKITELDKGMTGIIGNWKRLELYNVDIIGINCIAESNKITINNEKVEVQFQCESD